MYYASIALGLQTENLITVLGSLNDEPTMFVFGSFYKSYLLSNNKNKKVYV